MFVTWQVLTSIKEQLSAFINIDQRVRRVITHPLTKNPRNEESKLLFEALVYYRCPDVKTSYKNKYTTCLSGCSRQVLHAQ